MKLPTENGSGGEEIDEKNDAQWQARPKIKTES